MMTPTATATRCPRCLTGVLFPEPASVYDGLGATERTCYACGFVEYDSPPEDSDPGQRNRSDGRDRQAKRTRPRLGGNRQ